MATVGLQRCHLAPLSPTYKPPVFIHPQSRNMESSSHNQQNQWSCSSSESEFYSVSSPDIVSPDPSMDRGFSSSHWGPTCMLKISQTWRCCQEEAQIKTEEPERATAERQWEGEAEDEGSDQSSPPSQDLPASVRSSCRPNPDQDRDAPAHHTLHLVSVCSAGSQWRRAEPQEEQELQRQLIFSRDRWLFSVQVYGWRLGRARTGSLWWTVWGLLWS